MRFQNLTSNAPHKPCARPPLFPLSFLFPFPAPPFAFNRFFRLKAKAEPGLIFEVTKFDLKRAARAPCISSSFPALFPFSFEKWSLRRAVLPSQRHRPHLLKRGTPAGKITSPSSSKNGPSRPRTVFLKKIQKNLFSQTFFLFFLAYYF